VLNSCAERKRRRKGIRKREEESNVGRKEGERHFQQDQEVHQIEIW
jgi:hypothetical protein